MPKSMHCDEIFDCLCWSLFDSYFEFLLSLVFAVMFYFYFRTITHE